MKASSSQLLTLRPVLPLRPQLKNASPFLTPPPRSAPPPLYQSSRSRPFINDALTPLQTLTASRILPYPSSDLFALIADISSYSSFVPYCTSSSITSHSAPDPKFSKTWPRAADLRVGFESYNEVYRSRVFCLPNTVLEAVAGDAQSTIPKSQLPHYYDDGVSEEHLAEPGSEDGTSKLFASLLTRWTFREFPFKSPPTDGKRLQDAGQDEESAPRTEVNLVIEVRFANAMYSAMSQAAAPKVAGMMIGAFEKRAREVLGEGHAAGHEGIERAGKGEQSALDGVIGRG